MKLHEFQAAVANRAIQMLLSADSREAHYESEFLTDRYKVASAVAEAIRLEVESANVKIGYGPNGPDYPL